MFIQDVLDRATAVVNSCTSTSELETAKVYCELFSKKVPKAVEGEFRLFINDLFYYKYYDLLGTNYTHIE